MKTANKNIALSDHRTDHKSDETLDDDLMRWTTKTIKSSPREIMKAQLLLITGAMAMNLVVTCIVWGNLPKYTFGLLSAYTLSLILTIYFILIVRQKTIFNYRITKQQGETEYFHYYPRLAAPLFKFLAVFTLLIFVGATIYSGSFLFMIGPAAMALGSAKFLLGWKNEIKHLTSSPWREYNFVTVDRTRLIVISHRTNPTVGFEARFPNTQLLDQYLKTLKMLLPNTATYIEKNWEW